MTRILNRLRATTTYGKQDIRDLTFSGSEAEGEYIHERDFERSITYAGWVRAYSETERLRELLLTNVQVWENEGESTDVPMLYLARPDVDMHMEFPYKTEKDQHHAEAQKSSNTVQRD